MGCEQKISYRSQSYLRVSDSPGIVADLTISSRWNYRKSAAIDQKLRCLEQVMRKEVLENVTLTGHGEIKGSNGNKRLANVFEESEVGKSDQKYKELKTSVSLEAQNKGSREES